MENIKNYIEHPGKTVETDKRFKHVMAIALDSRSGYKEGIIRCITSREGNVQVKGYVDRSVLHKVSGDSLERFAIGDRLDIKNESEVIEQLGGKDWDFIGLEDPDIWIEEKSGSTHLYFTLPFKNKTQDEMIIGLGHAEGENLNSLAMTPPVLFDASMKNSAKEVSIAPLNKQGFRNNLVESSDIIDGMWYSTVRVARADDMGKPWEFGDTIFHPKERNIPWIGGHASPGPLLPDTFIDVGVSKSLGIINGREANQKIGDKVKYGMFSVGLFIYDYENGKIDWVSPEPFIQDSQAKTITFASQFVETQKGSGFLYAHVDDSFVRVYTIETEKVRSLLP